MKTAKIVTIICWLVTAIILIGLAVWFLPGSLFGIDSGFNFNIGTLEDLTGPFDKVGSYTLEDDSIDSISVDWVAGEISITPYDGSDIVITEYARRELSENETLAYAVNSGTLEIKYESKALNFNMLTKKLEVLVPQSLAEQLSRLNIDSTSAEITAAGFSVSTLEINQTSGSISLTDIQSDTAELNTTSGEILTNGLTASKLTLDAVSGDIVLTDTYADTVICGTTSGNQQFEGLFNTLDLSSVAGDIDITSSVNPDNIECETTSGNIRMTLPGDNDLSVSFSTVSGDFYSEVPVTTGGNNASYYFDTVSGDLKITVAE